MDYLAFGLLAGSLIVIASFAVRDGGLHLTAIPEDSRLARWSRADVPISWGRWCADLGLALSAAGTLVLMTTAATLLAGIADGAARLIVGVAVAIALVASVLVAARLTQRLGVESDAERSGELLIIPPAATPSVESAPIISPTVAPAASDVARTPIPATLPDPRSLWDDDLTAWGPAEAAGSATTPAAPSAPAEPTTEASGVPARVPESHAAARVPTPFDPEASEADGADLLADTFEERETAVAESQLSQPASGAGYFSSPLLADIGVASDDVTRETAFRSSLLSDLFEVSETPDSVDGEATDTLLDETPVPLQTTTRSRDESDIR